jgi:CheY-like chemotaxis protein
MSHRILVAEDNAAMANVVKFALEKASHHVTVARDGQIAWKAVQQQPFDLIVADEQMPNMTGRELCQTMRAHEGLAAIPFILVTAKRWEIDMETLAADFGITQLLAKPFSPAELVEVVGVILATSQQNVI